MWITIALRLFVLQTYLINALGIKLNDLREN